MSDGDPVAWYLIEEGWKVVDRGGSDVGTVESILGDPNADIFHGLLIATGLLGGRRYGGAEKVGAITEGCVHLSLAGSDVERLPANADV
jgi:hypothetical protein